MTSFLDRLRGRPVTFKAADWKAVTNYQPWASGYYLESLRDSPQAKAKACLRAYKVGWFYKGGKKIADSVASLDWGISSGDSESDASETELDRPDLDIPFERLQPIDQFQRLLERPNPMQTGRQLLHKTQIRLDFAGTAFWYLEGGQGRELPSAIYGISPSRMTPSYARDGTIIGWVMDIDEPSGGTPFDASEIVVFSTGNAESDSDPFGVSVVEAVYTEVPLTDLMAKHTGDVLTTGGRLAGMLWPKERALGEDEFTDAMRAWRNVTSDPNAARRLLLFPEPMEYATGASTPAEIGIPELAALNRDNILTAFPISPYQLGVPMPGGLNSGETRREDRRDFWEGTIEPRVALLKEVIQTNLVSRYEQATGQTYDFDLPIPNLDDAPTLIEKVGAFKGMVSIGLDPKESLVAVGLDHVKFLGLPELLDPAKQAEAARAAAEAQQKPGDQGGGVVSTATDTTNRDSSQTRVEVSKALTIPERGMKARDDVAKVGTQSISTFLDDQRERVISQLRDSLPQSKSARKAWAAKADPDWWDSAVEDVALRQALQEVYLRSAQGSLQVVADNLGRLVPKGAHQRVVADLLEYGGERIVDMNAKTLQAITLELAEGTRRGYSIAQLIDGVPAEGFRGVKDVGLENGVGVWGDARAETIARTETALSYNRASLDGYKEFRVSRVIALDGDTDAECANRNGAEFSIDDAFSIADHPNGTLDWAPVVDR